MDECIIRAKNVVYKYDGAQNAAVNGIDVEIAKGEFVAILGRNGSGKSTFGKLLNALCRPDEGEVCVDGMTATDDDSAYELRKSCGMIFQNPDNQIVATIVEEDVAFGLENLGIPPEEIRRRVDESLEAVGMSEYKKSAPHMLSGGQKQRIAIAGVIAMRPKIIVFDESTAMLDPVGRKDVFEIARKLNRDEGITIVWITHFMNEAARADRVLVMDDGKVIKDGLPAEVFSDVEGIRSIGLDAPEMTILAEALRKDGLEIRKGIMTVDEMAVELCRLK